MQEVSNDLTLVHDFYYGSQTREVGSLVAYRAFVLEGGGVERVTEQTPGSRKHLWRAGGKSELLWYFRGVAVRLLQKQDTT